MAGRRKRPLRVAVIGCGRIAPLHLSAAVDAPEAKLVACCDLDKKKAKAAARKYHACAFRNFRRMIFWKRPKAVHICLPPHLHAIVADYCLMKKIHVLSETPMALDLASSERTVRLASLVEREYAVLLQHRYEATAQLVKRALTSGRLGPILSVRSVLTWNGSDETYDEGDRKGLWAKEGGSILLDRAIHTLDLVNWLVDSEVENVSCTMSNRNHPTRTVADSAEGFVLYENGVRYGFYFMNNYERDVPADIRMVCENGEVVFADHSVTVTYRDGTVETARENATTPECELAFGGGARYASEIRRFYRACRGEELLEIGGKAALATHRLAFSLYEAACKQGIYHVAGEAAAAPSEDGTGIKIRYY